MSYSLRRRLVFTLLTTVFIILGITAGISYQKARHEVAELFDAELAQSAKLIHTLVKTNGITAADCSTTDPADIPVVNHEYEKKLAFQIWSLDTRKMLLCSQSAPIFPLADNQAGFKSVLINGQHWHVFSLLNSGYIIHVGQQHYIRDELTTDIANQLLYQFLIGVPLLAIAVWLIIGRSLKDIVQLSAHLQTRKADNLSELVIKKIPKEIIPLVDSLNDLLRRLQIAFANERDFTANAAHELRTPLAGLLIQTELALNAKDSETPTKALLQIQTAAQRMTHLVEQLLTLARLEPQEIISTHCLNLADETLTIIAELEPLAFHQQIELSLDCQASPLINSTPQLLNILATNLIKNAIQYTPKSGKVEISIYQQKNKAILTIADSGVGISEELREQVFQRFYRSVDTANQVQGSGLGLAIVAKIIRLHHADIELTTADLGGLQVCVKFPLITEPTVNY